MTHEILNRGWNGPQNNPYSHTVVCTCGQAFTRYLRHDAGLAWQEHRDELERKPLAVRFQEFHAEHPEVYEALVRLARQGHDAGARRLGIAQLFEVLRWEWVLSALPASNEAWKLNNDYKSRYSRLIMQNEEWAAGLFEIRRLHT
jgi:hypothetical protein